MSGVEMKALGDEAVKTKNYPEALGYYTNAIELNPTAALFSNRSLVHLKLKKYKEAVTDALLAIQMNESWAKPYARLSEAADKLGEFQMAVEAIKHAMKLEPENIIYKNIFQKYKKITDGQGREYFFSNFERSGTGIMAYEDFKLMRRMARDMNPDNFSVDDFQKLLRLHESSSKNGLDYASWCAYLDNNPQEFENLDHLYYMPSVMGHYSVISDIENNSNFTPEIAQTIATFLNAVLFHYRLQENPRMDLAFLASHHEPKILQGLKMSTKCGFPPCYSTFIGVPDHDSKLIVFSISWVNRQPGNFAKIDHHLGYLENGNMKIIDEKHYARILVKIFEFFDVSWSGCVKISLSRKLQRLKREKFEFEIKNLLGRKVFVEECRPSISDVLNDRLANLMGNI